MSLPQKSDSLGRRYLTKLLANLTTIPLFFVLEAILPRALGPATYGNYSFATVLFQNFTTFLDMGTSTCLHTALAKRPDESALLAFYLRIAGIVLLLCVLAGGILCIPGVSDVLMPDVPVWLALPAALWAYLTWTGKVTRGISDALGLTVRSEKVRVGGNILSALLLVALFFGGVLTLPVLFAQQYVILLLLTIGYIWAFRNSFSGLSVLAVSPQRKLSSEQSQRYKQEFKRYSGPLFVVALCTALSLFGERWMLQYFEGSVAQGYFSLSQKVGMACFLFVTAMTPLLMRELAVAHGKNDTHEMARLLDKFAPMLYAAAAWVSCFTVIEAEAVIAIFGGAQFAEALLPVQIMALYPIHQGYGQVAASVFYASGKTHLLRNLTYICLAVGLVATWVCLAPANLGGYGLGASGLAFKTVFVQIFSVNLLLFFCRREAPFKFGRNLAHQLVCPVMLLGIAYAARFLTEMFAAGQAQSLVRFFVSGIVYCVASFFVLAIFPFVFGVTREDKRAYCGKFFGLLRSKKQ